MTGYEIIGRLTVGFAVIAAYGWVTALIEGIGA